MLWQATYGILDALLVTGLVIAPIGVVAVGSALRDAPGFGKALSGTSVVLGAGGIAAGVAVVIEVSAVAAVGVLGLVVFHLAVGWRLHKLGGPPRASARGRGIGGRGIGPGVREDVAPDA